MIALIWLAVLLGAVTLYLRQVYSRFSKYGVKQAKSVKPVPFLGNLVKGLTRQRHIADELNDMYHSFPEERFVGRYEFTTPIVIVRDLELVKKITVKDFEHFLDHRKMVDESLEPIFGRNLFSLRGQEWKDMRSMLSPAFTSSKMRLMVPFMVEISDQMIGSLKKQIKESNVDYVDVDCKDLTTRYASDVIASCAFGLKVDSHTDPHNEFYVVGKETATFGFRMVLLIFGYNSFPALMKNKVLRDIVNAPWYIRNEDLHRDLKVDFVKDTIKKYAEAHEYRLHHHVNVEAIQLLDNTDLKLNIKLFSETTNKFFRSIVIGTMNDREKNNILRPDMIHLLMEAKKGKLTHEGKTTEAYTGFATVEESDVGKRIINREWSDDDLVAQAVLFFLAGFEAISSALSFLLYELAVNPDVQERLVREIEEHDFKNGGKFDFNSLQNMPYLDMVISEVLRLWPTSTFQDRLCTKNYNMGKPNAKEEKDFIIHKGEAILVPTWVFHHNPDFFPDPYKFDPERFSEQNKHNIKPFTYIPFGLGPRNCIGSRFALCEIKVMTCKLLQQMEVSPCEKTVIPAVLAKDTITLRIKGGHYVRFRVRK